MRKLLLLLTALVTALLLPMSPAQAASATELPPVLHEAPEATTAALAANPIYTGWLWPASARAAGICVENKLSGLIDPTGGGAWDSGVLWAVLRWRENSAPYLYYRDDNGCDHLDWSQKVIVQPIADYTKKWCGKAYPTTYSGAPRSLYKMIVYINLSSHPDFNGCYGNRQRRYHVITHEMGHAGAGLNDLSEPTDEGWGNSIMDYSTDYRTVPTALDAYRMNWVNNESGWA